MRSNPVSLLRKLAFWEGVSFLLLLGVAMPLKYVFHYPTAVKLMGWAHGMLFIAFSISLLYTMCVARWPLGRAAITFIAALLPFAPFVWDRRLRQFESDLEKDHLRGENETCSEDTPSNPCCSGSSEGTLS